MWDGRWTERVRDHELDGIDPPGIDPAPEAVRSEEPADPITDAHHPLRYRPHSLPRVLALALVLVAIILVLIVVGIATA